MKKIIYILFILLICTQSKAQINFENSYNTGGFDYARAIIQTYDSGYVTVGSTEGNFGLSDLYILKINPTGDIIWAKRYGGSNVDWGQDIIETYDSNLMMIGFSNSSINNDYDIYLVKTDRNGDSLYTKKISWNDWDFAYSLKETPDSGYIIAGETYQNGNSQALLIKTNKGGDTIWTKTYGGSGNDKFEKVIITASGDFIMAGTTESFGNQKQAYIIKTDSVGNVVWEKDFGNAGNDFAKSLLELSNGEIVFVGATNTPPETDYDNWIVRLNTLGVQVFDNKIIDHSSPPTQHNDDYFEAIAEIRDSLIAGGNRSYEYTEPGNVYFTLSDKTTSNWGRSLIKYASTEFESIHDIKKCKDGGIIFASSTESSGSNGSNIYLIKIDSNLVYPSEFYNSITKKYDISSIENNTNTNKIVEFYTYPNPTQGILNFKIKSNRQNNQIVITDITGKQIKTFKNINSNFQYNFAKYKNGIYLASLLVNDRFVKQIKIIISK
jgi:hypothetical protein